MRPLPYSIRHNLAMPQGPTRLVRNGRTGHAIIGDEIPVPTYETMKRFGPGQMRCMVCLRTMATKEVLRHLRCKTHVRKKAAT